MSAHKWGESPIGRWTLRVESRTPKTRDSQRSAIENEPGELTYFGLRLFGTYSSNTDKKKHSKTARIKCFCSNRTRVRMDI